MEVDDPQRAGQSRKSPLAFGSGAFGMAILTETFNGFVYFYYVDFLGLALISAALVRTVFAIWDAIDDPLMGLLSDHTRSRWGRRRPWHVVGVPLLMLVFVLVFSVPPAFQVASRLLFYMLTTMLVFETLNTIFNVNFIALYAELFQFLVERARVATYIQSGTIFGQLVGLALAPLMFQKLGFSAMAAIYALAVGVLFLIYLLYNRESLAVTGGQWSDLWPVLRGILADRVYWLYILMIILTSFSAGLVPFALPFYVKYTMGAPNSTVSLLYAAGLLASLPTMLAWPKMVNKWGLRTVFLATIAGLSLGLIGLGIFTALPGILFSIIIFGMALQGTNVCNIVIRATLISRNISRTGRQNEASYYGMMNSALRLGGLLQSLSMLLVGALFGYVSGEAPGHNPGGAFRFLISVLPVISLVVAAVFAGLFFKAAESKTEPVPAA